MVGLYICKDIYLSYETVTQFLASNKNMNNMQFRSNCPYKFEGFPKACGNASLISLRNQSSKVVGYHIKPGGLSDSLVLGVI